MKNFLNSIIDPYFLVIIGWFLYFTYRIARKRNGLDAIIGFFLFIMIASRISSYYGLIKEKVALWVVWTSLVCIIISFILYLFYDHFRLRRSMIEKYEQDEK